ncbi:MAG: 3-deoxy-manno-octulosonate cytidylyltransferase [Candidatus Brocadiaceae bacterium]|nr:3-deoxy-manno-octulosonate cytidylyltransferase [Candidatus Brocadiaceae bacterium]
MKAVAIIPARYASTRLPGKPILEAARQTTGKYIIQHVYERAAAAPSVSRVIVATDDARIARAVQDFGGEARMTSPDHQSGTDRIAEAAVGVDAAIIVNVQGDEPEIRPEQVEQVVRLLADDGDAVMGTLAHPIASEREWRDPNVVKVVTDARGGALYFSRSPIPYTRDAGGWAANGPLNALHHLGIYSYRRDFLFRYASLPLAPLELAERLEQLRALSAGYRIKVGVTPHACIGIDTPEDLQAWLARHTAGSA